MTASGYPEHVVDAALSLRPRWLTGLIARHGEPLIVRDVGADFARRTSYSWTALTAAVAVGQFGGGHYIIATNGGRSVHLAGLRQPPTDAEVSAVVALAGLDDAPEQAS